MGMRINHNIEALLAQRYLGDASSQLERSMAKLSSGLRIERASDDPSGLAISERLRSQVSGLALAENNLRDGIGMLETADTAMGEVTSKLQRLRELALRYNSGTLDTAQQNAIISEVATISAELDTIGAGGITYNGITVIGAAPTVDLVTDADGTITTVNLADMMTAFGLNGEISNFAQIVPPAAGPSMTNIDATISALNAERARIGATVNQLESMIAVNNAQSENIQAAESRIRDVDMAEEMANMTRLQVLQQSALAMVAQANQLPASLLSLLQQ